MTVYVVSSHEHGVWGIYTNPEVAEENKKKATYHLGCMGSMTWASVKEMELDKEIK